MKEQPISLSSHSNIAQHILSSHSMRVGPHMCDYIFERACDDSAPRAIAIMGGDARTGAAVRRTIDLAQIPIDETTAPRENSARGH